MALIKDEWVIRKTSTITIDKANKYIRDQLDIKQEDESNYDTSGKFIDNFFADLFDTRDGSLYRIYSVGATNNPHQVDGDADAGDSYYSIVNLADVITKIDNSGTFLKVNDASTTYATKAELPDLSDYRVEDEIVQMINGKIEKIQIDEVIIG